MNCILYIIPLSWKKENVVRQIYKNLKLDIDISILQSVSIKTIGGYNTNTMKKTFMLHFATINALRHSHATNMLRKFTIQKQESIQGIDNIRFLDVFCVLTVHYSNKQI